MENEKDTVLSVQNEALGAAAEHIRVQRKARADLRVLAYCLTALLCVSLVCGTVWGCYSIHEQQKTILEQQYALNMQYASLMEYVAGAEIETTTNTASADGRGTAVAGDGNTTVVGGGDLNGDS